MPLPQLVHRYFCQFRDPPDVSEPVPGKIAKRAAWLVLAALALQLIIGISMVLEGFPLWLATAHNAGAAVLLMATVALNRAVRPPA